jgi:hypothetical protein
MEKQVFAVSERVGKLCAKCAEERGHICDSHNQTRADFTCELS